MAYALDNPVKKISQMGPSNSLWYYTDGDAIGDIDNDDYFILSHKELKAGDIIIVNRDHLLSKAKDAVLEMSEGYKAPEMETFKLPGTSGRLAITTMVKGYVKTKKISEHDALIANKLSYVF